MSKKPSKMKKPEKHRSSLAEEEVYNNDDQIELSDDDIDFKKKVDKKHQQEEEEKKPKKAFSQPKLFKQAASKRKSEPKSKAKEELDPKVELKERRKLELMIAKRRKEFPEETAEVTTNPSMSIEKLQSKIHEMDLRIAEGTGAVGSVTTLIIDQLAGFAEVYGGVAGLDLQGFREVLMTSEEGRRCVKELALKYDSVEAIPIEIRFGMVSIGLAMSVNRYNQKKKIDDTVAKMEVNQEETKDL